MRVKNVLSLLMTLSFSILVSNGQNLKTYNGPFKVGFGFQEAGKAIYTYYEDKNTLDRVKQGLFNYTLSLKNDINGTFFKKITGSYSHGLKNGLWQYGLTYTDFARSESDDLSINATGNITLVAPYLNGLPNGVWVYKKRISFRDKHYFWGKLVTSPYQLFEQTNISVSFKNGVFSGPIRIISNNYSLTGSFDSSGNLNGEWVVKTKDNEEITDYKNGLVMRRINRALPNGEVLERETDDVVLKQDFLSGKLNEKDIEALDYTIEKRNVFKEKSITLTGNIFNDADFIYTTLLGDKLIDVNKDGGFYFNNIQYNGGNFIKINVIKFLDVKNDYNFKTAEEAFN
jgi:hypothetical protein